MPSGILLNFPTCINGVSAHVSHLFQTSVLKSRLLGYDVPQQDLACCPMPSYMTTFDQHSQIWLRHIYPSSFTGLKATFIHKTHGCLSAHIVC